MMLALNIYRPLSNNGGIVLYHDTEISNLLYFRLAFIEDYTLKSLRLKTEKWNKLVISDDQRGFLHSFVDQGINFVTVFP